MTMSPEEEAAYVERERETAKALLAELKADKDAPPGTRPWAYHKLDRLRDASSSLTDTLRQIRRLIIELDEHRADRALGWKAGLVELIYQRTMLAPEVIRLIKGMDSCVTINSLIDAAGAKRGGIVPMVVVKLHRLASKHGLRVRKVDGVARVYWRENNAIRFEVAEDFENAARIILSRVSPGFTDEVTLELERIRQHGQPNPRRTGSRPRYSGG